MSLLQVRYISVYQRLSVPIMQEI